MRLVEIAEIAARIGRIAFLPERRGVAELHSRIFLGGFDDEGAVVAEGGRQDQVCLVEIDHRLHRLGDRIRLGHVLLLDDGDARHLLEDVHGHRMGLVPAEIVARSDIDRAEHDGGLRPRQAEGQSGGGDAGGAGLEKRTSGQ